MTNGTDITGTVTSTPDDSNGSIEINGVDINGSGIIANMNFTVIGNVNDSTDISIVVKDLTNNTSMPVDRQPVITNGTFEVTEQVTTCPEGVEDCTAPVTTISGVDDGGVYNENVTITLSATDDKSGVNETIYTVNGGTTTTYSAPFIVDTVGDNEVAYWSTDNAGNIEPENMVTFTIKEPVPFTPCDPDNQTGDCEHPVTTISGVTEGTTYNNSVEVTLNATDDDSGVNETFFMVNGGTTETYSGPFIVDTVGNDNISYWSTDFAGNIEPQNIITFIIGEIAPSPGNGAIKGKVFRDSNHNGILDANEHAQKNVRVSIKGLDETNKDISKKVIANTKGYMFSNIPDGKYSVHVSHKHGFTHTSDTTVEVTIINGETVTVNFGNKKTH